MHRLYNSNNIAENANQFLFKTYDSRVNPTCIKKLQLKNDLIFY